MADIYRDQDEVPPDTIDATDEKETEQRHPSRPAWRPGMNFIKLLASLIVAVITYLITYALDFQLRMALVLLVLAAALWITESIPLAATSLLIALLQPLFGIQGFNDALAPFFNPVVVLLLGGFLLAIAVDRHDLDERMGEAILKRLGSKPHWIVLGLMLGTALLSMWISNTAAAALMITVAIPVANRVEDPKGKLQKIMILAVAYSASLGGFMTLIGSPPNALAAAFLALPPASTPISFLGWSLYALPLALLMIFVTWGILFARFRTDVKYIPPVETSTNRELTGRQKGTLVIFLLAVALWLTEPFHPLNSAMVAAAIAVILFVVGLLKREDVKKVDWNTLLLFGGGLSLGAALQVSGLADVITGGILTLVPIVGYVGIVALLAIAALLFSMVASNTASASIFIPISISVAISSGANPVIFAVLIAICSSIDFMLPIGTPPNAIAYSTGRVTMKDMITTGIALNILSLLVTLILAYFIWPFVPVI
ncbi:MAG: SLC13 family permease [Promethearchaeota archaeon]